MRAGRKQQQIQCNKIALATSNKRDGISKITFFYQCYSNVIEVMILRTPFFVPIEKVKYGRDKWCTFESRIKHFVSSVEKLSGLEKFHRWNWTSYCVRIFWVAPPFFSFLIVWTKKNALRKSLRIRSKYPLLVPNCLAFHIFTVFYFCVYSSIIQVIVWYSEFENYIGIDWQSTPFPE